MRDSITASIDDAADAACSIPTGEIITTCCTTNILACNGTVIFVIHLRLDYRVALVLLNARPSRRRVLFEQRNIKGRETIVVIGLGIRVVVLWFHRCRSLKRGLPRLGRFIGSGRGGGGGGRRIRSNMYSSFSDDQAATATIGPLSALLIFHCN